eukprot:1194570-Prorocentrum_minimum.AAC.5
MDVWLTSMCAWLVSMYVWLAPTRTWLASTDAWLASPSQQRKAVGHSRTCGDTLIQERRAYARRRHKGEAFSFCLSLYLSISSSLAPGGRRPGTSGRRNV